MGFTVIDFLRKEGWELEGCFVRRRSDEDAEVVFMVVWKGLV